MEMQSLIIYERPNLVQPYLVMGFEGWPDAGRVSSGVVSQLRDKLEAKKFAEVKADDFYMFQSPGVEVRRPPTDIEDGLVKALSLPSTSFWFYKNDKSAHDLIISLGMEPELRWNNYVDLVLDLAQEFGVQRLYTVGGTYDTVPHTIEPMISAVLNDASLKAEMREYGVGLIDYKGPSSIHTMLVVTASKRELKAASLWGHVPSYIQVPNAKVCYGILSKLARMLEIALDLEDLKKASEYLDDQVSKAIKQKPELEDYVRRLEEEYSKGRYEAGEPLAEDIIKEVEDFLRKRKDEE